ncbi:MAG TPA: 3-hydroxybutyryl-CoA dehydrogenase [Bdellovibrionota bacterium]|nr:3-hydroxybutyryl-CoA dehydrogenase [Bdellovibrionota bacterium]
MKFGVIGAGQMGSGIAQVAAQTGYEVLVVDASSGALDKAKVGIQKSLEKLHAKGVITESVESVAKRLRYAGDLAEFKTFAPDLVVEAVTENFELKKSLFTKLDEVCPAKTVLASNTSSISITKIAACTGRPEKVVGMHFMNPVPLMKLVELIRGIATSEETYQLVKDASEKMQKTTIVARDLPGFVVNRILMPMINEAVYALMEGLASVEDIDAGMKLGTNQPMGPLTLADFIGLDTCLYIMQVLHEGLGDTKYRPCPLLKTYVDAGWLGRKSGRGFYKYDK